MLNGAAGIPPADEKAWNLHGSGCGHFRFTPISWHIEETHPTSVTVFASSFLGTYLPRP